MFKMLFVQVSWKPSPHPNTNLALTVLCVEALIVQIK